MQHPLAQEGFRSERSSRRNAADDLGLIPWRWKQAILNLLTNAMKYSGNSRRLELLVKRTEKEAAIEVRDWGIGIAPE